MNYSTKNFKSMLPPHELGNINTPQWWEAQNIPWQLVVELRRRKHSRNIGVHNIRDMCFNFKDNHSKYRGPLTPWVKCFSNGTGERSNPSVPQGSVLTDKGGNPIIYNGFLLEGGVGFFKGYGEDNSNTTENKFTRNNQVLGYDANGNPHYIKEQTTQNQFNISNDKFTPTMLPPPGIVSVDIQTMSSLITSATIKWNCYGLQQLEYMLPFFLTPRINIFLEFGWNLFNIKSLVNYSDTSISLIDQREQNLYLSNNIDPTGLSKTHNLGDCLDLIINPQNAYERAYNSLGNYGVISGIIWKYNYVQKDHIKFECTTEIISRQALYAGYKIDDENKEISSLKQYFTEYIKELKNIVGRSATMAEKNILKTNPTDTLVKVNNKLNELDNDISKLKEEYNKFATITKTQHSPAYAHQYINPTEVTKIVDTETSLEIKKELNDKLKERDQVYNLLQRQNTNFISYINVEKLKKQPTTTFYGGKIEDRFFHVIPNFTCIQQLPISSKNKENIKEDIHRKNEELNKKINIHSEKIINFLKDNYDIPKTHTVNNVTYTPTLKNRLEIAKNKEHGFTSTGESLKYQKHRKELNILINELNVLKNEKNNLVNWNTRIKSNVATEKRVVSNPENLTKTNESYSEHGWVQLDFVFELINYLVGMISNNKINKINIENTIVTAHPNIISSNPNILIPNSIAPKINIAAPYITDAPNNLIDIDMYHDMIDYIMSNETFTIDNVNEFNKKYKVNYDLEIIKSIKDNIDNDKLTFNTLTHLNKQTKEMNVYLNQTFTAELPTFCDNSDYLMECQDVCKRMFLTSNNKNNVYSRDNLDAIINYNYYNLSGKPEGSAAFPQYIKNNKNINTHQPYTFGYLKHIYISVSEIINKFNELDAKNNNLQSIVKSILNLVNESVGYYWALDIIQTENGELQIVDKNISLEQGEQIYMFEIGTSDSMIKNFSFNVNLTNEQTTQILYSTGNNVEYMFPDEIKNKQNSNTENKNIINYIKSDYSVGDLSTRSLPSMAYNDRLEEIITQIHKSDPQTQKNENQLNFKDSNIEKIQSGVIGDVVYYRIRKHIDSTSVNPFRTYPVEFVDSINYNDYSYVMLNFPKILQSKLKRILFTPQIYDFEKNKTKNNLNVDGGYTGPADNFTITVTFDGIMGFRLFQYFAIANLPAPYKPENTIFMVKEVKHQITRDKWETVVTAMLRSSANQGYNFITV